ncbi:Aste57867_10148 [Aphanomyces stellatus]|uniref:Aste57867_10148 protein n=1 Tax=Aphanomyces stellatus TaxID=120398 RepID=A0A485KQL1_9STRA|nr:hypothetical protein As57867_010109 [Aphanomyces stellatus]VFT87024.1 Aste57867_10148 [Aphanomyces stellatus]
MKDTLGAEVAVLPATAAVVTSAPQRLHVFSRKPRHQAKQHAPRLAWAKTKPKENNGAAAVWPMQGPPSACLKVKKKTATTVVCGKMRRPSFDSVLADFKSNVGSASQYFELLPLPSEPIRVGIASTQGTRPYMEDRHVVSEELFPHASMIGIYDGHNGAWAAEYAASRLGPLLSSNAALRGHAKDPLRAVDEIYAILTDAFAVLDDEIVAWTKQHGRRDGATALLMLVLHDVVFVANVGDSRAVLHRTTNNNGNSPTQRVSVDHKPNVAAEKARILQAGGKVIFSGCWRVAHASSTLRLAVSRSLGDHPLKLKSTHDIPLVSAAPAIFHFERTAGDMLVLASDGLWDRVEDDEAVQHAQEMQGLSLPATAAALIELALVRRTCDNVTAAVVVF